ncbi:MAG: ATP-binding protein [Anaerolineae bacterium]
MKIQIEGANEHNLKNVDVEIGEGLTVVTGVSGSGKSTLLIDTLGRALAPRKHTTSVASEPIDPGEHDAIKGAPGRAILVDQTKAGVRSPAHFLGLTRLLHQLYAESEDARALGLDAKALGQRCSACGGSGQTTLDMGFLPDVHVVCETCQGTGYRPEAWEVRLRGVPLPLCFTKTLDEVRALFGDMPGVTSGDASATLNAKLEMAQAVGLGYLVLHQPGYALSGGEAQRLKIADELYRTGRTKTLYILDEPTVGQHLEDVHRLVGALDRLVDQGHTVYVIEHHTHLLAACDWLVELGPGGGPDGGRIIAEGSPETVAAGDTPTARYLRPLMDAEVAR